MAVREGAAIQGDAKRDPAIAKRQHWSLPRSFNQPRRSRLNTGHRGLWRAWVRNAMPGCSLGPHQLRIRRAAGWARGPSASDQSAGPGSRSNRRARHATHQARSILRGVGTGVLRMRRRGTRTPRHRMDVSGAGRLTTIHVAPAEDHRFRSDASQQDHREKRKDEPASKSHTISEVRSGLRRRHSRTPHRHRSGGLRNGR
jgi:hypothetical protein